MKAYCPRNGCGRPNGAATPCPIICSHCGHGTTIKPYTYTNIDKVCPACGFCSSCRRLGKKAYELKVSLMMQKIVGASIS